MRSLKVDGIYLAAEFLKVSLRTWGRRKRKTPGLRGGRGFRYSRFASGSASLYAPFTGKGGVALQTAGEFYENGGVNNRNALAALRTHMVPEGTEGFVGELLAHGVGDTLLVDPTLHQRAKAP